MKSYFGLWCAVAIAVNAAMLGWFGGKQSIAAQCEEVKQFAVDDIRYACNKITPK